MDPAPLTVSPIRGLVPALAERQKRALVEERRIKEEKEALNAKVDNDDNMPNPPSTDVKDEIQLEKIKEENKREEIDLQLQAAKRRLEMDSNKAYQDIQNRLNHEEFKKRRELEEKLERLKDRENKRKLLIEEKKLKMKRHYLKNKWIEYKNKVLDAIRKKNNRII